MRFLALSFSLVLVSSAAAADGFGFVRTESRSAKPGNRPRRLSRTLMFAQRQPYELSQNMLHRYTDRPLFADPGLRAAGSAAAFLCDIGVLKDCGLDGFGSLDYFPVHLSQLRMLEAQKEQIAGYSQMIVLPGYSPLDRFESVKDMILTASKSRYTTRLDGKLLLWIYGGGAEAHRKWAEKLESDPQIPDFVLVGDMPFLDFHNAWNNGQPSDEAVDRSRAEIASAADVLGGFQLWCSDCTMDYAGEYGWSTIPAMDYRRHLLPTALEVLGRPGFQDKLLGAYIRNGYVNPFTGVVYKEDGTARLRGYLDEILPANPDVLMLFEWNEANENTHFQPTVAHGRTWARILAYYRALLDHEPLKPRANDDPAIPNVIVSNRRSLKLGEPYHLELLYLPDGDDAAELKMRATLKGAGGRMIGRFPLERTDGKGLIAFSYRVPSESFAQEDAVFVELETDYRGVRKEWTGFGATSLSATTCRDYLYVHAPLREMLRPDAVSFDVKRVAEIGRAHV